MTPRENNPAPDSYAKSQIPERDHGRARIAWWIGAGFTTFAIWGVGLWLCSGEWAV